MDRVFVWIVATILALAGVLYLVSPATPTASAGISADASGLTDIRATYGGFQIGLAIFLVWCARSQVALALLLTTFVIGAVLLSRVAGLLMDGSLTAFHLGALGFEVPTTALALWLYSRSSNA